MIISLLLLAIFLLVYLLASSNNVHMHNDIQQDKQNSKQPDIVGPAKSAIRQIMPTVDTKSISEKVKAASHNFDVIDGDNPPEIPQEGPEEALNVLPDWRVEEEDMERYAGLSTEEGLATGVTFDELAAVGRLLERKALEPSEKDIAAGMLSRIDGTELLGLLESRVGDASKRIAMLLDGKLTGQAEAGSSFLRNDENENFNVGDYI